MSATEWGCLGPSGRIWVPVGAAGDSESFVREFAAQTGLALVRSVDGGEWQRIDQGDGLVYVTPGHPVKAGAGYDCHCGQCLHVRAQQAPAPAGVTCQCEHEIHMPLPGTEAQAARWPAGAASSSIHPYGAGIVAHADVVERSTPLGAFRLCGWCDQHEHMR